MPERAPRPCGHPACPGFALPNDRGLCAEHEARAQQARDAARGNPNARGYGSRWQKAREGFLAKHSTCARCGATANVLDHIVPHRGSQKLFWDRTNWQPLCGPCHQLKTASEDGRWGAYANRPRSMRRSVIPLTVVCGPPGAGKTTLIARFRRPEDLVMDLEDYKARVAGLPLYHADHGATVRDALRKRNWDLLALCEPDVQARKGWRHAWLSSWEERASDRNWWRDVAGARVVLVLPPIEECIRHVRENPLRPPESIAEGVECVRTWFSRYTADPADLVVTNAREASL